MGVSVVLGEANHSLCSGSPSDHFQLGSLGKESQAFRHLHQEPGQSFLAELSLCECLQRVSDPSSGANVTLNSEAGAGHLGENLGQLEVGGVSQG